VARGWESKSVELQMEEAAERKLATAGRELAAVEKELLRELRVLQLSRTRVLQQISDASSDRYREMMSGALADLDEKVAEMEKKISGGVG